MAGTTVDRTLIRRMAVLPAYRFSNNVPVVYGPNGGRDEGFSISGRSSRWTVEQDRTLHCWSGTIPRSHQTEQALRCDNTRIIVSDSHRYESSEIPDR